MHLCVMHILIYCSCKYKLIVAIDFTSVHVRIFTHLFKFIQHLQDMPKSLGSSATGFQGCPEYSEPGDWLDYEYNTIVSSVEDDTLMSLMPSSHSSSSPPSKKGKCTSTEDFAIKTKNMRLPTPCPLLTLFTEDVKQAIAANNIKE